jgi:hypothetical protein
MRQFTRRIQIHYPEKGRRKGGVIFQKYGPNGMPSGGKAVTRNMVQSCFWGIQLLKDGRL